MVKNINDLAEANKRLDKKNKMESICKLMVEYSISMGDLIEYYDQGGSAIVVDSKRLAEINQARKHARKLNEARILGMQKAREAKKEKRQKLIDSVPTDAVIQVAINGALDE